MGWCVDVGCIIISMCYIMGIRRVCCIEVVCIVDIRGKTTLRFLWSLRWGVYSFYVDVI